MECPNCGKQIEGSTKFCIYCGHQMEQQEEAASVENVAQESTVQNHLQHQPQQTSQKKSQQPNKYMEKGKVISKNYWEFFLDHLKAPSLEVESTQDKQPVNGYINLILIAFFLSLAPYFQVRALSGGYIELPFFKSFLYSLIFTLVAFVVIIAVLLLIVKVLMSVNVSFKAIAARFGALMTIPLVLSVLYFLVSLPGMPKTALVLLCLLMAGGVTAIAVTIYDHKEQGKGGLDPFFGVLIVIVACLLFGAVMMNVGIGSFIPFYPSGGLF